MIGISNKRRDAEVQPELAELQYLEVLLVVRVANAGGQRELVGDIVATLAEYRPGAVFLLDLRVLPVDETERSKRIGRYDQVRTEEERADLPAEAAVCLARETEFLRELIRVGTVLSHRGNKNRARERQHGAAEYRRGRVKRNTRGDLRRAGEVDDAAVDIAAAGAIGLLVGRDRVEAGVIEVPGEVQRRAL